MSDYKMVNGKMVRACKYCQTVVAWNDSNKFFIEPDHNEVEHTRERCKAFQEISRDPNKKQVVDTMKEIEQTTTNNKNHSQITLEMVQKKLESIGIIINIDRLMKE